MNTVEDRVRAALRAQAEEFSADPDAWARIRTRRRAARPRRRGPRWSRLSRVLIPAAAAAAVVAIVVAAVALSDAFGRATGAPAGGARSKPASTASPGALPSPAGPYSPSGPASEMLTVDPAASAVIGLDIPRAAGNANRAIGYFWVGYASPRYWFDQITPGPQFCNDTVNVTNGQSSGFCWPLPRLGAGRLASVTGNESVGTGQTILLGAAVPTVTSVAAVLPDGQSVAGVVETGRGFRDKAWTVGYPPAKGVRLVFRDAAGAQVASLSTAAPIGPPQTAQPRGGGLALFRYPGSRAEPAGAVTAYLIEGRVGFWSPLWGGYVAPVPAATGPAADGLIMSFGQTASRAHPKSPPKLSEAFGYARGNVARIVVHLPGGRSAATSTVAAWPGSGLRLWAVSVPANIDYVPHAFTVTAYDAAGHAIQTDTLGQPG